MANESKRCGCLICGAPANGLGTVDEGTGVVECGYCANWYCFDEEGYLRFPTPKECYLASVRRQKKQELQKKLQKEAELRKEAESQKGIKWFKKLKGEKETGLQKNENVETCKVEVLPSDLTPISKYYPGLLVDVLDHTQPGIKFKSEVHQNLKLLEKELEVEQKKTTDDRTLS